MASKESTIIMDCRRRGHDVSPEHTLREAYAMAKQLNTNAIVICRCHQFEFNATDDIEQIVSEYYWRASDFERA